MIYKNKLSFLMAGMIGLIGLTASAANNAHPIQPDNSAINERDRPDGSKTADRQASTGKKHDVELVRMIRQDLTNDYSLSTYGKNVKILSQDGVITLRGPVRTREEKLQIGSTAKKTAGVNRVNNQLQIKQ